jgi:hypothetical protein
MSDRNDVLLREWREQLSATLGRAAGLADGLSDAQFNWRPGPARWSLAQCLDHLNKVGGLLLPGIEAALRAEKDAGPSGGGAPPTWRPSLLERWFIHAVSPASRFKAPVPRVYVPAERGAVGEIVPAFVATHERLIACMSEAEGRDLRRLQVISPASRAVRLSLGAWFAALTAHAEYHVEQAQAVKQAPDFPRA